MQEQCVELHSVVNHKLMIHSHNALVTDNNKLNSDLVCLVTKANISFRNVRFHEILMSTLKCWIIDICIRRTCERPSFTFYIFGVAGVFLMILDEQLLRHLLKYMATLLQLVVCKDLLGQPSTSSPNYNGWSSDKCPVMPVLCPSSFVVRLTNDRVKAQCTRTGRTPWQTPGNQSDVWQVAEATRKRTSDCLLVALRSWSQQPPRNSTLLLGVPGAQRQSAVNEKFLYCMDYWIKQLQSEQHHRSRH